MFKDNKPTAIKQNLLFLLLASFFATSIIIYTNLQDYLSLSVVIKLLCAFLTAPVLCFGLLCYYLRNNKNLLTVINVVFTSLFIFIVILHSDIIIYLNQSLGILTNTTLDKDRQLFNIDVYALLPFTIQILFVIIPAIISTIAIYFLSKIHFN